MKKYLLILFGLLLITGCASTAGESRLERLSHWPTRPPITPSARPTPFPRLSLAQVATPTATPPDRATASPDKPQPPTVLPESIQLRVASHALNMRQGPGIEYDKFGILAQGERLTLLALNPARTWALAQSDNPGRGWVSLQYVEVVAGSLADAQAIESVPPRPPVQQAAYHEPDGGRLVFQRSSGGDIMLINADGSGLRRLTGGIDPVLSPDGQTVAFTRWEGGGSVWLINSDGSDERQLLGFIKQPKGPDWSPDGSRLVVNFQHEGRLRVKTVCHDLSEGEPPAPPANAYGYLDEAGRPKVSVEVHEESGEVDVDFCWKLPPDPHWSLRMVNLADSSFEDLDGGTYAFRPAWDPARPWRIVSDGGRGLLAVDINRGEHERLTEKVSDGSPVFSPDGRYIALMGGQDRDIYRMNSDGTGRARLTQTPLWVTVMPGQPEPWHNVAPAWSPDGSRIAFLTDRTGRWEIWVMNLDGSDQHPLFSEAVNARLDISYNFVDERVLSWR